MAKEFIVNTLVNFLGDYVEGFTKENIKVGILSGKIVLKGLGINREGVRRRLNLPINVVYGYIETLEVHVPWKNLDKEHVQIFIEGVHLLVTPLYEATHSKADAQQRVYLLRKYRLFQAEKSIKVAAQLTKTPDGMKHVSYFQSMAARMVENIDTKVGHIHIRFEDPQKDIAYGFLLESFSIVTTDSNWHEAYVGAEASVSGVPTSRYKLISLRDIGVYWNNASVMSFHLPFEEWLRFMKNINSPPVIANYLLQPPNEWIMKISHQTPNLMIHMESVSLSFVVDKKQYHQIKQTTAAIHHFHRMQRFIQHRPELSAGVDPGGWWRYALLLVTENERILQTKMGIAIMCCRYRSRYVDIIRRKNLLQFSHAMKRAQLTDDEEDFLDEAERALPLHTLILFRQLGVKQALVYNKQHGRSADVDLRAKKRFSLNLDVNLKAPAKWLRRLSLSRRDDDSSGRAGAGGLSDEALRNMGDNGRNSDIRTRATSAEDAWQSGMRECVDDDMDVSDEVTDEFQAIVDRVLELEDNLATFTLQYSIRSSITLLLTSDAVPVATVRAAAGMEGTLRASGYQGSLSITDFVVFDDITPNPVFNRIVSLHRSSTKQEAHLTSRILSLTGDDEDGSGMLSHPVVVKCESRLRRTKVVIYAVPLEVCCHPLCIQKLLDILMVPNTESLKPRIRKKYHDMFADSSNVPLGGGTLNHPNDEVDGSDRDSTDSGPIEPIIDMLLGSVELQLEASAPKFIFPEDCCEDIGYLLVDMGHLSVYGSVQFSCMSWRLSLSDVCLAMPSSAENMYSDDISRDNLIEPFEIFTSLKTQKKNCLAVSMEVSVDNCIRGDIDALKLARLLRIWDVISHTFFRVRSLYRLKQLILQASTSTDDQLMYRTALDFAPAQVDICVSVQQIQVSCHNLAIDNVVVICISCMSSTVCKDIYDMRIGVSFMSLTVEDMGRSVAQRCIVAAPNENGDNFVKLSLLVIRDRKSPLYEEFGTIVNIECGKLVVSSDSASLRHFRPFVEVLRGKKLVDYSPLVRSLPEDLTSPHAATPRFLFAQSSTPFVAPAGLHIMVTLRQLSVSLLRPHASYVTLDAIDPRSLEVVVVVNIDGVSCNGKLKGKMDIALGLSKIQIQDCRQRSSDNCFKTLLSYSSSHQSRRESTQRMSHEENKSSTTDNGDIQPPDQMTLSYKQGLGVDPEVTKWIEVVIRDVHGYVSLDAALDIAEAVSVHVQDTAALFAKPPDVTVGVAAALDTAAANMRVMLALHTFLSSLHAKIKVLNPQLVLLEDPTAPTSRAVVCQSLLDFRFIGSSILDHTVLQITETVQLSAANTQIFVVLNMCTWQPVQILHPMCVHIHASNSVVDSVSTSLAFTVNVDDIVSRITIDDVLLLQSIIVRRTANDYAPPVYVVPADSEVSSVDNKDADGSSPCTDTATATRYTPTHVILWKAIFTLGKASVVLINDTQGYRLAMARLTVDQVHFKADGSSHGVMVGSGSLMISMDYYNPVVNEWEPCIEGFYPEVTVNGDSRSLSACVLYSNCIQLNLTSTMLSLLSETLSFVDNIDSAEDSVRTISSSAVVTFRNDLGLPIDIFDTDSACGKLFRIEPGQEAMLYLVHHSPYSQRSVPAPTVTYSADGLHLTLATLPSAVDLQVVNTLSELTYRRVCDLPLTAKTATHYPLTPLQFISWNSRVTPDGSRIIRIQSTLEIVNDLPFHVDVISNHAVEATGPIREHEVAVMPLVYADCAGVAFKPSDLPYEWSENILCVRQEKDYNRMLDLKCYDEHSNDVITFRVRITQSQNSVCVHLFPASMITNALPCAVRYKCVAHAGVGDDSRAGGAIEQGTLDAGGTAVLSHMGTDTERYLLLYIEGLGWSTGKTLRPAEKQESVNMQFMGEDKQNVLLIVSVSYSRTADRETLAIVVYSKYFLVDRTSLGVSLSTRVDKNDGSNRITRMTYEESVFETAPTDTADDVVIVEVADGRTLAVPDTSTVLLINFTVKSRRRYEVTVAGIGTRIHTDRDMFLSYIPILLRGHTFIATPSDDRSLVMDCSSSLIEFSVDQAVIVCLIFDQRSKRLPLWVRKGSFQRVVGQCISRGVEGGVMKEKFYEVYGKFYAAGSRVSLGYNYSHDTKDMYCVCVLPGEKTAANMDLWEQVHHDPREASLQAEKHWARGGRGITLFNCENGRVKLGVNNGSAWTRSSFSIKNLRGKVALEIVDDVTNIGYQIAYKIHRLPAVFEQTQVLTVMNRYCIVNCTGEPISVRQVTGDGMPSTFLTVGAYATQAWHKSCADSGTDIQLKCQSTDWSLGNLDINEVGTTQLFLPFLQGGQHIFPTIVNVEVKLAEYVDNCVVSIIFWRSNEGRLSPLSIKNDSHYVVSLLQAHITTEYQPYCEVHVPPNVWVPYGWVRPEKELQVLATLADSVRLASPYHCCKMNVFDSNSNKQVLSDVVVLSCESQAHGRIIRIRDYTDQYDAVSSPVTKRNILWDIFHMTHRKYYSVTSSVQSVALSIIADKPERREFFVVTLRDLQAKVMFSKNVVSVDCSITDLQIDNHAETAIHSVLLWRPPDYNESSRDIGGTPPFVQFAGVREVNPGPPSSVIYHYITGRVMPFLLEVDSATLELFVIDILSSLHVISADERKAQLRSVEWIHNYSAELLSPLNSLRMVDIHDCLRYCQQSKALFENIVFHPIRMFVTFTSLPLPRDRDKDSVASVWIDLLGAFVTVDLLEVRLKSFIVSCAVESVEGLARRLQAKVVQDVLSQLAKIAGSVVLGSPAGLVRNIGGGVQDFFYEPAAGIVQSPVAFLKGIGNGTGSLVSGVISGTFSSTASFVGGVSNGLSFLSGDVDFVRSRSEQRSRTHAARGGVLAGLKEGGESFVMGIANGLTGIFTKPYEEAQRDGALGFVRGIGIGVAGMAVKPVLGITDGISSVAKGVANEVGGKLDTVAQRRSSRAFSRSTDDPSVLVLTKYDPATARAQRFVRKFAKKRKILDKFVCVSSIDEASTLIFSEHFLFWEREGEIVWLSPWSDVKCALLAQPLVEIILVGKGQDEARIRVLCRGESRCLKLYNCFVKNAFRVMDPASIICPPSVVTRSTGESDCEEVN